MDWRTNLTTAISLPKRFFYLVLVISQQLHENSAQGRYQKVLCLAQSVTLAKNLQILLYYAKAVLLISRVREMLMCIHLWTRLCKRCKQLPSVKWEGDLMLQVIMLCCISCKVCWSSRGEGEGAVVLFSWRLSGLTVLEKVCKTRTCFLLKARPSLCPRLMLRNGNSYSIWVNREEKRQINNEADWTLPALLFHSSLRGLKRWYWDGLLSKSVQLLTFTAAEQFSSSITISHLQRE